MSEFEPKPAPERRAKAFKGARERIVKTDAVVEKTKGALQHEQIRHRETKHERDLFAAVIRDPARKAFLESMYRQVGACLADEAIKHLLAALAEEGVRAQVLERIWEYAHEAGDDVAADIVRAYVRDGVTDVRAMERPEDMAAVVSAQIDLPPVRVRFSRVFGLRDFR
jgi:hypothetical protein